MRRRGLVATVLIAAVTSAVGGCSSAGSSGASPAPSPVGTVAGSTAAGTPGPSAPSTATGSLSSALLTTADLPNGFAVVAVPSAGPASSTPKDCYARFNGLGRKDSVSQAGAEISFRNAAAGSVVEQSVQRYAGAGTASPTIANLAALLKDCAQFDGSGAGATTRYTSAALDFPSLGDRTVAVRIAGSIGSVAIVLDVVGVQQGADVVFVAFGSTKADPGLLEKLVRTSLAKLKPTR